MFQRSLAAVFVSLTMAAAWAVPDGSSPKPYSVTVERVGEETRIVSHIMLAGSTCPNSGQGCQVVVRFEVRDTDDTLIDSAVKSIGLLPSGGTDYRKDEVLYVSKPNEFGRYTVNSSLYTSESLRSLVAESSVDFRLGKE